MCLGLNVDLPTVGSFLLLYTLRQGNIVILIWTVMRSLFTLFFFMIVILEGLVKRDSPFGKLFVHSETPTTEDNIFHLFYCSMVLIIAEAFLVVFCYYLAHAIICMRAKPMVHYLVCRFSVWLIEVTNLIVLTLVHNLLIGWYLSLLMIIVLEFYGFVIVYSYYMEILECFDDRSPCKTCRH